MLKTIREALDNLELTEDFLSRHPHPKHYLAAHNGELTPATTAALRTHYESCSCCAEAMEIIVSLGEATREMVRQCVEGADVWEKAALN